VYAVKNPHFHPQWARLMAAAKVLDARLGLGLARVVKDLRARPDPSA
jgi:hypothetical protein